MNDSDCVAGEQRASPGGGQRGHPGASSQHPAAGAAPAELPAAPRARVAGGRVVQLVAADQPAAGCPLAATAAADSATAANRIAAAAVACEGRGSYRSG